MEGLEEGRNVGIKEGRNEEKKNTFVSLYQELKLEVKKIAQIVKVSEVFARDTLKDAAVHY